MQTPDTLLTPARRARPEDWLLDDSGSMSRAERPGRLGAVPDRSVARAHADPEGITDADLTRLYAWAEGEVNADARTDGFDRERWVPPPTGLPQLARRLWSKAEMARWRADGSPVADLGRVRSAAGEAGTLGAWVLRDEAPTADAASWGALAEAYRAAAASAEVLAAFAEAGEPLVAGSLFAETVQAAAEAQSALRAAFYGLRGIDAAAVLPSAFRDEGDQRRLFGWLRRTTAACRVYVARHLRVGDVADPADAPAVERRVRTLAGRAGLRLGGRSDALVNAVAYHAGRLGGARDQAYEAGRLVAKLEAAVAGGVGAADPRLLDVLAPVEDLLPASDDLSDGAASVLRAVRGEDDVAARADEAAGDGYGPQVARAAALLRGKRVAVFGGVPKCERERALVEAFGLAGLEWVGGRDVSSPAAFEPVVARVDVAVLLIRWCSHSFEALRAQCDAHGTAYVRLPAGYHPNAVAHHVLDQVSEALAA